MKFLVLFFVFFAPIVWAEDIEDEIRDLQRIQGETLKKLENVKNMSFPGDKIANAQRKVLKLATNERFLKAAGDLWANPNRDKMLIAQGVFFLFMFFFKAWRQARALFWFTKILVGFFLSVVTWVGILYVIPAIVLGEPFRIFVNTIWKVFWKG